MGMALVGNRELILINSSVPGLREFCVLRHARFLEKTSGEVPVFSRKRSFGFRHAPGFSRKHTGGACFLEKTCTWNSVFLDIQVGLFPYV